MFWRSLLAASLLLNTPAWVFVPDGLGVAQAQSQKKVALVIGNKDYLSSPLQNTLNDARDMAAKLRQLGFTVILKENLNDEKAMKRALLESAQQIQPGGTFLFYYSGHGMQVNGTNYLIPTQAEINKQEDVEFEALNFNRVLSEIEAGKASVNIVLLDACRNNPYSSGFKAATKGLAGITQSPAGTFIGFATAPGGVSSDNVSERNGLFTGELLKYLDEPGLKIEDVFKRTARGVQSRERQTPWSNSSLVEDFYFVPPPSSPLRPLTVPPSAPPVVPSVPPSVKPPANYTVLDPECVACPASAQAGENVIIKVKVKYGGPEQVRAVVDWGDGSPQTMGGWLTEQGVSTLGHRYGRGGRYTIQVRSWTQSGLKSNNLLRQSIDIAVPKPSPTPVPLTAPKRPVKPSPSLQQPVKPPPSRAPQSYQSGTLSNSLGMKFKRIPAGAFMMGSPAGEAGRESDERQYRVTLTEDYYMQTTEVTQAQWQAVMGNNPSYFKGSNLPVEKVSWEDVQIFISKLNARGEGTYRLPTEAEWEYAARAGSSTRYACGDSDSCVEQMGWFGSNSGNKTQPVAQKVPNAWGLYDMHGNVCEWVQDWYAEEYPSDSSSNPRGASGGYGRVVRGGYWGRPTYFARSADRYYDYPSNGDDAAGFRVVRLP